MTRKWFLGAAGLFIVACSSDLKLARIVGTATMGAGGNIIGVGMSPHLKIGLTQTASIIYRLDGSPLENVGTTPDTLLRSSSDYFTKLTAILDSQLQ